MAKIWETNPYKLDKTFKLSKTSKRRMCAIADKTSRDNYRHAMLDAEVVAKNTERWIMK
jgi:hypothetical protein